MFEGIELANPEYLWGLIALPLVIVWYVYKRKLQQARLTISSTKGFEGVRSNLARFQPLLFVFRICALAFVVLALARPQTVDVSSRTKTNKGIDIVMAIDVSSSMLAQDLKPSRLNALKEVAADFIDDRQNDRIGLVVYAGESYTKTPITSDKRIVKNALRSIRYDGVINDGTAIGMGLSIFFKSFEE